jgi:hypothetical protein
MATVQTSIEEAKQSADNHTEANLLTAWHSHSLLAVRLGLSYRGRPAGSIDLEFVSEFGAAAYWPAPLPCVCQPDPPQRACFREKREVVVIPNPRRG